MSDTPAGQVRFFALADWIRSRKNNTVPFFRLCRNLMKCKRGDQAEDTLGDTQSNADKVGVVQGRKVG